MLKTNRNLEVCTSRYISLARLLQDAQTFERMPVHLDEALRRTVWWTLAGEMAAILVALVLHADFLAHGVSSDFFLFGTDKWVSALLRACYAIMPLVLVVNSLNLCVTLAILAISRRLTSPVHEPVHWIAALQPIPTVLSGIAITSLGFLVALVTIVMMLVWAVIIFLVVCICLAALASALAA